MSIKVFADGADIKGMLEMYREGNVQGFTTNPSLMKKGGVSDYRAFAKEVLVQITDLPISFEVFADDPEGMEAEAREIATWADNVYVKIPALNTKGESTKELVRKLSKTASKSTSPPSLQASRSPTSSMRCRPMFRQSSRYSPVGLLTLALIPCRRLPMP